MIEAVNVFERIKKAKYIKGGESGNYAIELDEENRRMYVLFEESIGKEDWKHNFQFLPIPVKPYKDMKKVWFAHRGFIKVYKSIRDDLMLLFKETYKNNDIKTIVIAGWSHGGALAQLFLEDLDFNKMTISSGVSLYTFGSPRPFYSKKKVEHLADRFDCLNYENGSDIVPKLPPFAYTINTVHIGELFRLLKIGKTIDYHTDYGNSYLY